MGDASPGAVPDRSRLERDAADLAAHLVTRPNVTAICHENADGDTIGAAVAMARAAIRLGCQAEVVSVDGIPAAYEYLTRDLTVATEPSLDPGVAVICDSASIRRVGSIIDACDAWFAASSIACVDHHITNPGFGRWNFVDPGAAASCQVVAWLLDRMNVELDRDIATALLAGIVRDSHGFSSSATSAATLRAAADAVDAGADLESVYRSTMLDLPVAAIALYGRLLHDLHVEADGRIAWTVLTPGILEETGTDHPDAEGVAEFLARGHGVDIAILARDLGGATRFSLRTSGGVDAARLAAEFGGGGHTRRAGCTIEQAPQDAVELLLAASRRHLES